MRADARNWGIDWHSLRRTGAKNPRARLKTHSPAMRKRGVWRENPYLIDGLPSSAWDLHYPRSMCV
jgi:hypothetical protein